MNFTITELCKEHFEKGFFETLDNLCHEEKPIDMKKAQLLLRTIQENKNHFVFVALNENGEVIGTITLIIEQKFHRNFYTYGHLENVVTRKKYECLGIGKAMVEYTTKIAKKNGCDKIILSCNDKNMKFYKQCGYKEGSNSMKINLEE